MVWIVNYYPGLNGWRVFDSKHKVEEGVYVRLRLSSCTKMLNRRKLIKYSI